MEKGSLGSSVEVMIFNLTSWDSPQTREGSLDPMEGVRENPFVWTAVTLVGYLEVCITTSAALDSTAMLHDYLYKILSNTVTACIDC